MFSVVQQIYKRSVSSIESTLWKSQCAVTMSALNELRQRFLASLPEQDRDLLAPDALGIGLAVSPPPAPPPKVANARKRPRDNVVSPIAVPAPRAAQSRRGNRAAGAPMDATPTLVEEGLPRGMPRPPSVPSFGWQDPALGLHRPVQQQSWPAGSLSASFSEPSLAMLRRHPKGSAESLLELANAPARPPSPSRPAPSSLPVDVGPAVLVLAEGRDSVSPAASEGPAVVGAPAPQPPRSVGEQSPVPTRGSPFTSGSPVSMRLSSSESSLSKLSAAVLVAKPPQAAVPPLPLFSSHAGAQAAAPGQSQLGSAMDLLLLQPISSFGDFISASVHTSRSYAIDDHVHAPDIADLGPMFDAPGHDGIAEDSEMI